MHIISSINLYSLLISSLLLVSLSSSYSHNNTCRSYCGNIPIDYPFALTYGCGHPNYRELLYCINHVLMLHIASGSYRVLNIDYTFQSLTLHEPHLSTCNTIVLGSQGNGFVVESWRASYLSPIPENAFLLIGCSAKSPLFQGHPSKNVPCRNISGLGCEDYYKCPAWARIEPTDVDQVFGSGPRECCAVGFDEFGPSLGINLTKLDCHGYSSAYTLAPLKHDGPHEWSYGIRVKYSLQGHDTFCKACEATRGTCGYTVDNGNEFTDLCLCGTRNTTSNCDSILVESMTASKAVISSASVDVILLLGMLLPIVLWNKG